MTIFYPFTIDELVDIRNNDLGKSIDISGYTGSNPYTTLSDGYLVVVARSGTNARVIAGVMGSTSTYSVTISAHYINGGNMWNSLYVKKGSRLYTNSMTSSSEYALFMPLQ